MKRNFNKRLAYALIIFLKLSVVLTEQGCLIAQDTTRLDVVEIKTIKTEISHIGKKTDVSDSLLMAQYKFNSLGDFLSGNSNVFIKNYGAGALSTTSMRGGNAAQTALLWNGFNLQNTMLGQVDLSLLPNFLFDNVTVEYGGSSSVWGSGAVGGSIQLSSKQLFNQGLSTTFNLGGNSTGGKNSSAKLIISKKKFISSTKLFFNLSSNQFNYRDPNDSSGKILSAKNNSFSTQGLLQEFKFLIKTNQSLQLSAWLQSSTRQLPANDYQSSSSGNQADEAYRFTGEWRYYHGKFTNVIKSCFFQDKIDYFDFAQAYNSTSVTRTFMFESENYFRWYKNQEINLSLNALSSSANSGNYINKKEMNRLSLLLGNQSNFLKNKLITSASLRLEYYTPTRLPVTGNLAFDFLLIQHLHLKGSLAKVYRQPSLNEMYWQPGGNPDLKAEQGYSADGEIVYARHLKELTWSISLSAFNRMMNNWIAWLPGSNGNPSPVNIQSVWSRGTETEWKMDYRYRKLRMGLLFRTSYVLSTVNSTSQENDNSVGKQLIYTPRYLVNTTGYAGFKNSSFFIFHNYTGYRFVTSDNLSWVDPYHTISVKFNYEVKFKKSHLNVFLACNNLLNENYVIIANKPMPLRYYEIGLNFLLTKNQTKK